MNFLVAVGISIGVLAGIWTEACGPLGLYPWIGFLSWAAFYAAGGKVDGMKKAIPAHLSGVFWGFIIIAIMGVIGGAGIPFALGIAVVIGAFAMCVQAHLPILGFIPGSFIGAASYFGAGASTDVLIPVAISLVCGAVLGYISEVVALKMTKKEA